MSETSIPLANLTGAWDRLPPPLQDAIARTILGAAGQQTGPAPRRRHQHYGDAKITELRARIVGILATSPTLPHRVIAERLGVPFSTYKLLQLNRFAGQALAASTHPHSAVSANYRHYGQRANEGDSGRED